MAKISFTLPDGTEKTFRLVADRPLRIGREPGNDAVLRDAKVSRRHAEVTFERGFYVIHDIGSANGTWINGRRIRVAPLTDGAEMRVGATFGRFTEEISSQEPAGDVKDDDEGSHFKTEPPDLPPPPDFGTPPPPPAFAPPEPDDEVRTKPHVKGGSQLLEEQPEELAPEEIEPEPEAGSETRAVTPPSDPPIVPTTQAAPLPKLDSPPPVDDPHRFDQSRYLIDTRGPSHGLVCSETEVPLLHFRPPLTTTVLVAAFVAALMVLAGTGTALMLGLSGELIPAAAALVLTVVFTAMTLALIPPRNIELFEDEAMSTLSLVILQESRASFPRLRFSARTSEGTAIAYFHKNVLSNVGRRRWAILHPVERRVIGAAYEESLLRALARKFVGSMSRSLTTDFLIEAGGRIVGKITRRASGLYQSLLRLDQPGSFTDARIPIALAVLIESVERR